MSRKTKDILEKEVECLLDMFYCCGICKHFKPGFFPKGLGECKRRNEPQFYAHRVRGCFQWKGVPVDYE